MHRYIYTTAGRDQNRCLRILSVNQKFVINDDLIGRWHLMDEFIESLFGRWRPDEGVLAEDRNIAEQTTLDAIFISLPSDAEQLIYLVQTGTFIY